MSRYGRIPLGRDDEAPEFRTSSWIAMMFSAGMGIGLMFYGVAEPLAHFTSPPPGTAAPGSPEAFDVAMATTLFHWTLHPWAIYAVVGLAIAYGTFRRGRPQLLSSAFIPLFGRKRAEGGFGKAVDILAIFATLFGSAASLGLGALQIGGGLIAGGFMSSVSTTLLVVIIVTLTICFILSAVSGVSKGVQWLSNVNMVLAGVLALVVFVGGPTVLILNLLPTAIGDYFTNLAQMAARTAATGGDATATWLAGWTVFYWAWWISWTPFVGMFIARISRGRTIRQFIAGVVLIPSAVSLVWFAIFGGAAINLQRSGTDLASRLHRGPAVRAARHHAAGRGARCDRDAPGGHLLRVRGGRRVDRHGHALPARHHPPHPRRRRLLGRHHGGDRRNHARGRRRRGRRAGRHPEHHDHHGRPVRGWSWC